MPLVKIFAFLSKSITTWTVGLGTPLAAVVVSFVVTFRDAGVEVDFESFFGAITASIDCVLPSAPDRRGTGDGDRGRDRGWRPSTTRLTIKVERLRIELLLRLELRGAFPFP